MTDHRSNRALEARLDQPRDVTRRGMRLPSPDPERFGILAEKFARWMGTAQFLMYMTVFVAAWLAWNTFMPAAVQFDPRDLNYTLLTLILSLQASYAAPLILLAQNRQDDRDRVALEQDRARDERNLADTEYLTREVAALRIALRDMATRDFLRSELRDLLDELREEAQEAEPAEPKAKKKTGKAKNAKPRPKATRPAEPDPIADEARARLAGEQRRTAGEGDAEADDDGSTGVRGQAPRDPGPPASGG